MEGGFKIIYTFSGISLNGKFVSILASEDNKTQG